MFLFFNDFICMKKIRAHCRVIFLLYVNRKKIYSTFLKNKCNKNIFNLNKKEYFQG